MFMEITAITNIANPMMMYLLRNLFSFSIGKPVRILNKA